jgi:hypothetical protein
MQIGQNKNSMRRSTRNGTDVFFFDDNQKKSQIHVDFNKGVPLKGAITYSVGCNLLDSRSGQSLSQVTS